MFVDSEAATVVQDRQRPEARAEPRGSQTEIEFEPGLGAVWLWLRPVGAPCFNPRLLEEIREFDDWLEHPGASSSAPSDLRYSVIGSRSPGVFSFGGDLALFAQLIERRDREALADYARLCLNSVHNRVRGLRSGSMASIALVQGAALGGGFECALAADVLVAEESARLGLPEVLFNLFPGMGAYHLLARRIGVHAAERLILSGDVLGAGELHEMGVVDVLAGHGEGEIAVRRWMSSANGRWNSLQALLRTRRIVHPIARADLDAVGEVWVDAALRVSERERQVMRRLERRQRAAKFCP
jgi:DSF synthase